MNIPARVWTKTPILSYYLPSICTRNCEQICIKTKCRILHNVRTVHVSNQCGGGKIFWDSFRRSKEANERSKAKLFTSLSRRLEIAIREGGSNDPRRNNQLAAAIQECKNANMSKSTIENALKAKQTEEYPFSIAGPNGVCIIIVCATTSRQNAKNVLQSAFKVLSQFSLDAQTQNQFERKRIMMTDIGHIDENDINDEIATDIAINVGAEDVEVIRDEKGTLLRFISGESGHAEIEKAIESDPNDLILFSSKPGFVPSTLIELNERDKHTVNLFYQTLSKLDRRVSYKYELVDFFHNVNGLTTTFHI